MVKEIDLLQNEFSGLNVVLRKLAKSVPASVVLIKIDEETYSFNTKVMLMTVPQKFKPGEEIVSRTSDGSTVICKSSFTIAGNVLTEKQIGDKSFVITREFTDDEMISVSTVGSVVCRAWYKVVN